MEAPVNNFDITILADSTTTRADRLVSCLWSLYPEGTGSLATDITAIMPRAQAGQRQIYKTTEPQSMLTLTGVLVECDASIKAIIVNINTANGNAYIIEDIDDEHVLIQASKHQELKDKLNAVCA